MKGKSRRALWRLFFRVRTVTHATLKKGTTEKSVIKWLNIDDLKPYERNARTHPQKQIDQIAKSIKRFGFTNPVLIDERNEIIAGHGRVLGAVVAGRDRVPCIVMEGLTAAEKKAYRIADNQIALGSGWDNSLLETEIESLGDGFDLDMLGFDGGLLGEKEIADVDDDEQFIVIVECDDEQHQQKIFDHIKKKGWKCKLMS